ncbi:MAG: thioredoxin family protein [Cyclobacteriaceae bacterium]|nr:thioredoxin family protein [Cyclobacteriaceae bacterium]
MLYLQSAILALLMVLPGADIANGLKVGDQAVDFNLKNIDGKMISLQTDKQAKGYILIFTCNTCPYSVAYEDRIIELHQKFAPKGYPVLAIQPNDSKRSPGDSFDKMKKRAKDKGFPFPYLLDETQETTSTYGATNTPHVYVLNKQADETFKIEYIGAIDNNTRRAEDATKHYVKAAVEGLLKGQKVETTKTKAIGCTIKWSS